MSFSHSDSGRGHSGSEYVEEDVEIRFTKQKRSYEERCRKYEITINEHLDEIDECKEETIMWKKKHVDMEEHCRDLEKELERCKRKCEDLEHDAEMDDGEDDIMKRKY